MSRKVLSLVLVAVVHAAFAQDKLNELTVDRPGIAEAPFTVAPLDFQLETGFDYYRRTKGEVYFLPVSLFRTGISKAAELRITVKHIYDRTLPETLRGFAPLTIGIKTHIIEQRDWIPETDILADLVVPIGRSALQPEELGHNLLLLFQNDLSDKTAINYNIGWLWDGLSYQEQFTSSFCFNYLPNDRIGLFVEYYNFLRDQAHEHGMDGGMTFLLLPMLQADVSAGISTIKGDTNYFISSGISFRVD